MSLTQEQVLAFAITEIRQLLAGYLGSQADADLSVRIAAHLAYALHNQAHAVLEGKSFDTQQALRALGAVDSMLGTEYERRLPGLMTGLAGQAP
ncbi:hypothetical protein MWN52_00925 [Pseudoxanthomonas winnipegensis]|uniref:hypothetical protein n=1 Tax=Pseudoxanthomonas winnipegensis TaxID=2480810 RepID=UPI0025775BA0|nr:hypothetical protein [Pseudoxanthomonas winnipegensis]WJI15908.1 hypothetical protein MWN52_00925 [Pseudoxanthomonas winnipegensis]